MGGGDSPSAGLAEAEALGIFGREGVYIATYWTAPKPGSPAWFAFRMYRNADGKQGTFGSQSVRATSSASDTVSVFASKGSGYVDLILINKDLQAAHNLTVGLGKVSAVGPVQRFQYSDANSSAIVRLADTSASASLTLEVPRASITLLRVPVAH